MVDVVISIAAKVAEVLVVPIGKQICYPFKYKTNMEELKKQVQKLTDRRDMVQHSVDEAKRQGEEIEKFVEQWMKRVDEFAEKDVKPITEDEDKAGKLCSVGFCSNLMTRYSLSKKAEKTANDGIKLFGEATFQKVSHRPAIRRTKSVYARGYVDFGSRMPVFDAIVDALVNEDVNLIGVYGMGGVGKTTLVKRVAAQAIEDKLFDEVVMAEVTQTPDIKSLQKQIADELDLKFDKKSLPGRATQLRERLKKVTSVLLILDNIWQKVDLDVVGIPFWNDEKPGVTQEVDQGGRNADRTKWKLLLTSRDLDVLQNDMNTQENFFVDTLSDVEAKKLFWKTVNHSKEVDFNPIAIEILSKCAGLPIAIKTIASALRNKDLSDWKDALQWLRQSNPKPIKGMKESVYSTIEMSYNILGPEEQSLFLLFGLENAVCHLVTDDLFKYSMGLSLFKEVGTMQDARNRMHALIGNLKASCLLLDDNAKGFIKMHDIIHAVAISIASSKGKFMCIQNVTNMKEELEEKLPKDSIAVSHRFGDIKVLPEMLEFSKLKFLHLSQMEISLKIPDAFFGGVKELKVLDLTSFDLSLLPSSLCRLTNLHTLCLDYCLIGDIAIIGELKKLEILSFMGSEIKQLPGEIRQLTRLKLLDLSRCSKLTVITPNVLSSLTRLEELYMGNSFVQWDVDAQCNASLVELKALSNLTTLEMQVLDAQIMPPDLLFGKLERYRIFIGDVWKWSDEYLSWRMLKLKLNNCPFFNDGIKFLLNSVEDLHLDEPKGVTNVLQELNGEGFQQLKHLQIQNAPQIQAISNSLGWGLFYVFPQRLESLVLHNLINVQKIYHSQLTIKVIKVEKCDNLKHLALPMVGNLSQLQKIKVTHCNKLEVIAFEGDRQFHKSEQISKIEFTELRSMTLQCLPRLTRFGVNMLTPNVGFQEIVAVHDPDSFIHFLNQNDLFPRLEKLKLSSINLECRWLDQLPAMSSSCRTLTKLTMEECGGLEFLFSYSMVKSLMQLRKLEIRNCKSMEAIISTEEFAGGERLVEMIFPKLSILGMFGLPKLRRIGSGNSIKFPSLRELFINDCPNLKTFISGSMCETVIVSKEQETTNSCTGIHPLYDKKVSMPSLGNLILKYINSEVIWNNQFLAASSYLHNLNRLFIHDLCNLRYLLLSSMVNSLLQLKELEIVRCKLMEVVVVTEVERPSVLLFPALHHLHLEDLPKLRRFCDLTGNLIDLSSLTKLCIKKCPTMKTFTSNSLCANMTANTECCTINSTENLEADIQPFFDEKVHLSNLKELNIEQMDNLRKVWHNQLYSDSFCKLESICVNGCKLMEVVVVTEVERPNVVLFPILHHLHLKDLPKLATFCNFTSNSIDLSSLSELWIENCPTMKTFISNSLCANMTASMEYCTMNSKENLEADIQPFFDEKVRLSSLKELIIKQMDNLRKVWHNQLYPDSFYKLERLRVMGCNKLFNVFPSNMPGRLPSLEVLFVIECDSLEEIFELEALDSKKTYGMAAAQLKTLRLCNLPKLKQVWNMDSQVILSSQNLHSLSVDNCDSLESLFPAIIARGLKQLEKLYVVSCMMEEIIGKEDEVEPVPEFVFPQLTELQLSDLPRLKSFHSELYISKWPMLERLLVCRCNEVEMLALEFQSQGESRHDITSGQPLFLVDKIAFPNLNRLELNWNCLVNEMSYGKFLEYSFKLNGLVLLGPFKGSAICPLCFLCKLPKIISLAIDNGCLNELFLCEGRLCKEKHSELPSKLSSLELHGLSDSLLWETHSEFDKVAQNLATLQVSCCENIRSLVSSTMSFRNLTTLEVSNCGELVNLVASSTAKSLVQLTRLEITKCKKIEEIITHKEDEAEGSIIFNQLKYLGLNHLPSLTIFYSGSCTIEFPSLQEVTVRQCPNMKIFSRGDLSTPRLQALQMAETEKGGCWEGDLNTTIERQYIEKNGQCAKDR